MSETLETQNEEMEVVTGISEEGFEAGIKEIEKQVEDNEKFIELKKQLDSLTGTEAWKEVIEKKFIDGESERIKGAITDHNNMLGKDTIEIMIEKLMAIRHFKQFIATIIDDASIAESNLESLKESRTEWTKMYDEQNSTQLEQN